jgi:hypothetical protein
MIEPQAVSKLPITAAIAANDEATSIQELSFFLVFMSYFRFPGTFHFFGPSDFFGHLCG